MKGMNTVSDWTVERICYEPSDITASDTDFITRRR